MAYKIASGVEKHRASPDTFWIPSDDDKAGIQVGDYAKMIFNSDDGGSNERMWVKVTARDGDSFKGTLANKPYGLPLKYGADIEFGPDNIIEILTPEALQEKLENSE